MRKNFRSRAGLGRRAVRFGLLHAATADRHAGRRRDRRRRRRADRVGAYGRQRWRRHCRRHPRRRDWRADRQRRDGAALPPPLCAVGLERLRPARLPRLVLINPGFPRHGYSSRHGAVPSRPARLRPRDMTALPIPGQPARPPLRGLAQLWRAARLWPAELNHPALYRNAHGRGGAEGADRPRLRGVVALSDLGRRLDRPIGRRERARLARGQRLVERRDRPQLRLDRDRDRQSRP